MWRFVAILAIFGALWRQFFAQNRQKKYFYKSFDIDILAFEKRPYYCGDKFGDFSPKAGDFFSKTPGHTGCWVVLNKLILKLLDIQDTF